MKIKRKRSGALVISMPIEEGIILGSLPGRLRALLESPDFEDRATKRLFPPAYRQPDREAEYRNLVRTDLIREKLGSVAAFESTLARSELSGRRLKLVIPPDAFDRWLSFVNDMRLVLATELGVEEESWGEEVDPSHPRAEDWFLLHYLSWLEEAILRGQGVPEIDPDSIAPDAPGGPVTE